MKKAGAVLGFCVLILTLAVGFITIRPQEEKQIPDYLRIHIRANSNGADDQDIKYKVKDEIVSILTPTVAGITTKQAAIHAIEKNISLIEKAADSILAANGFSYKSSAVISQEEFPERVYDGIAVARGVYDALIINLGSGAGDNWWCVIYPPLCFTDSTADGGKGVIYKSKIAEIIKRFAG
jgi:stage II sporulation protein R